MNERTMTKKIITARTTDSIYDVANLMKKCDIGFVPIVEEKKIVGVITDRDIVVRAVSSNCDVNEKIEEYMTKHIVSIDVKESIENTLKKMTEEKIKRILVVEDTKVVGILSLSDIIESDIEPEAVIKSLKEIWEVTRNIDQMDAEIDEFYL